MAGPRVDLLGGEAEAQRTPPPPRNKGSSAKAPPGAVTQLKETRTSAGAVKTEGGW